jgi:hypothetical protein
VPQPVAVPGPQPVSAPPVDAGVAVARVASRPRPAPAAPSRAALTDAYHQALFENDAAGCARAVAALAAIGEDVARDRQLCDMLAGHCQAAIAALSARDGAAGALGVAMDYCPADGDLPDHRLARAQMQATHGRSAASCARRAAWVTTLAKDPSEAEQYGVNAIECFAAIGRCPDARAQAEALAQLRATTADLELQRIAPRCVNGL